MRNRTSSGQPASPPPIATVEQILERAGRGADAPRVASVQAERQRVRRKTAHMMPTLRKVAAAHGCELDESRVYAAADRYARRGVPAFRRNTALTGTKVARTRGCVARSRSTHRLRPGHRRSAATSATASCDPPDDEGEAPADVAAAATSGRAVA
jgi:hypothetical protein